MGRCQQLHSQPRAAGFFLRTRSWPVICTALVDALVDASSYVLFGTLDFSSILKGSPWTRVRKQQEE